MTREQPQDAVRPNARPSARAARVREALENFQDRVCDALSEREIEPWREDVFARGAGLSRPRVLTGDVIEKAGVNFTHSLGGSLPAAATARRPELAGARFEAVSVSLIVHPRNPYAPTSHANFRYFEATPASSDEAAWWFGGGFDLTPIYGFADDARHWHRTARDACAPFGEHLYPRFKTACDTYFYLPHRDEPRGVGGVFFDDYTGPGSVDDFEASFALVRALADAFLDAYLPILDRRRSIPWGARERRFQTYRRGRYVEFNLLHDRGTLFGLQVGGRTESILVSMPPVVRWVYDWRPRPGSPEEALTRDILRPRDWADEPMDDALNEPRDGHR